MMCRGKLMNNDEGQQEMSQEILSRGRCELSLAHSDRWST